MSAGCSGMLTMWCIITSRVHCQCLAPSRPSCWVSRFSCHSPPHFVCIICVLLKVVRKPMMAVWGLIEVWWMWSLLCHPMILCLHCLVNWICPVSSQVSWFGYPRTILTPEWILVWGSCPMNPDLSLWYSWEPRYRQVHMSWLDIDPSFPWPVL